METLCYHQSYLEWFGFIRKRQNGADIKVTIVRIAFLYTCLVQSMVPYMAYPYFHPDDPDALISALGASFAFILAPLSYFTFFLEENYVINTLAHIRTVVNDRKFSLNQNRSQ